MDYLQKSCGVYSEVIIFCDAPFDGDGLKFRRIVDGGETKYMRILRLYSLAANDLIFCVDNDVTLDMANFKNFVFGCNAGNFVAGWGKITALPCAGLTPHLIKIDKTVSHDFLRPLLWSLKIGISLPGQVFMFRKSLLKIPPEDTVFDDLQIGIAIKKSSLPFFYSRAVLGFETPKATLRELVRQRIRWAQGYAEIILLNRKSPLVLVHGVAWHCWWLLFWGIFFGCWAVGQTAAALCFALIVVMSLAKNKIGDCIFAALYLLIFPFLHIIWWSFVAINLVRRSRRSFKGLTQRRNFL